VILKRLDTGTQTVGPQLITVFDSGRFAFDFCDRTPILMCFQHYLGGQLDIVREDGLKAGDHVFHAIDVIVMQDHLADRFMLDCGFALRLIHYLFICLVHSNTIVGDQPIYWQVDFSEL
jgi:hypothetical protein